MWNSTDIAGRNWRRGAVLALAIGVLASTPSPGQPMPIAIQAVEDLRFGLLVIGSPGSGSVTVDPASGEREISGAIYPLGGGYGPARFEISGEPYARFVVRLPLRLDLGPGRRVQEIVAHPDLTGTLGIDGRAVLWVGGTLLVTPDAGPGRQDCLITVSVDYL